MSNSADIRYDRSVVIPTLLGILSLAVVLQWDVSSRQLLLFLIAAALGVSLFHAAFGFAGGWRRFLRERRSAAIRAQLVLLALASTAFLPLLAGVLPGVSVQGAYAPAGVSVLLGAFLFGIGMQLGSGCGSGTLYTVGGGQVRMLITLSFFIVGAVVGSVHLPWWLKLPSLGSVSLPASIGWQGALLLQLFILVLLYVLVAGSERRRFGQLEAIAGVKQQQSMPQRILFGPWPLLWGALSLALLSLATLLVAGHPWSITFAFGLWGTKIWSALGGGDQGVGRVGPAPRPATESRHGSATVALQTETEEPGTPADEEVVDPRLDPGGDRRGDRGQLPDDPVTVAGYQHRPGPMAADDVAGRDPAQVTLIVSDPAGGDGAGAACGGAAIRVVAQQ
mgnify:CR=1 FL=1